MGDISVPASNITGLTLLEVLVSLSIVAVIMGVIYGAYSSNVESIQLARQNGQVLQTARIILDRMTKDIESAFITGDGVLEAAQFGMVGEDKEIEGQPADRLDFTAVTHVPLADQDLQTDLCKIGYYVVKDEVDGGLVLYRRDDGALDADISQGGPSYELARKVTGLDITFQDSGGEESAHWNSLEGQGEGTLPALVRIRLTLEGQDGKEYSFATSIHPVLAWVGEAD